MKVFNIVFIIIFIVFAALQYNDPDPFIWIPFYLYASLLCFLAISGKHYPVLYTVGLVVYFLYAAYLFFDKTGVVSWVEEHQAENLVQSMKATKPWIEETREFGGLLMVIIVLIVNLLAAGKRRISSFDIN